jgi:hypothetical protein
MWSYTALDDSQPSGALRIAFREPGRKNPVILKTKLYLAYVRCLPYGLQWQQHIFTTNHDFWSRNVYYPGTRSQSQSPMGAFETHLSYDFTRRLWVSMDGNFWVGGHNESGRCRKPTHHSEKFSRRMHRRDTDQQAPVSETRL